jgi:hypothetical protein
MLYALLDGALPISELMNTLKVHPGEEGILRVQARNS